MTRRLIPPALILIAVTITVTALWSWWRWEPAAITVALTCVVAALIYDPEAHNNGEHS